MADSVKTIALEFKGYWLEAGKGNLPNASGVYCVYACTYDKSKDTVSLVRLLYIGESEDVRGRVDSHPRWADWKKRLTTGQQICLSAATVSSTDRERAEAALIFKQTPPCNSALTNVFPHDTTTIQASGTTALLTTSFTVQKGATQ
jgi:hypothetical protein